MTTPLENEELVKPPASLRPRSIAEYVYVRDRIFEIDSAVHGYRVAHKEIPIYWLDELKELQGKLNLILTKEEL